ncbi:MAG TPA: helix-turn-helix transcriptional regulator [Solirubrobacteraceae bacterium]|nr:helix-turn-helix transcriptional regulator [Solirubrobacteraceae bacterium]
MHTLVDLGIAPSATDRVAAARDVLRRGMAIAHRCGAPALATRARDALIAAGGRPRRPIHEGLDSLTRAERSVAELAATGRTNREIGHELYVTLNTVSTHLRSVYRKLNIGSRAQLTAHFGPAADSRRLGPDRSAPEQL